MKYTDGFILAVMAGNITDDMNSNRMVYFKPHTGHMYNIYIYIYTKQSDTCNNYWGFRNSTIQGARPKRLISRSTRN